VRVIFDFLLQVLRGSFALFLLLLIFILILLQSLEFLMFTMCVLVKSALSLFNSSSDDEQLNRLSALEIIIYIFPQLEFKVYDSVPDCFLALQSFSNTTSIGSSTSSVASCGAGVALVSSFLSLLSLAPPPPLPKSKSSPSLSSPKESSSSISNWSSGQDGGAILGLGSGLGLVTFLICAGLDLGLLLVDDDLTDLDETLKFAVSRLLDV